MKEIIETIQSASNFAGFLYGIAMICVRDSADILMHPLNTFFNGLLAGIVLQIAFDIIESLFPPEIRGILHRVLCTLLLASFVFLCYRQFFIAF